MIEKKVSCYLVKKQCDCGREFQYQPSEITTLEYPTHYTHICTKCGKIERFEKTYPYIEYKEEN